MTISASSPWPSLREVERVLVVGIGDAEAATSVEQLHLEAVTGADGLGTTRQLGRSFDQHGGVRARSTHRRHGSRAA